MQAKDLTVTPPRRWSDELGGIRWLPRIVDKTRAAIRGTLGDYLYGQSPMDRGFLRVLGLDYKAFTAIVREGGDDDERVLALLRERTPEGVERARAWSERLPQRYRWFLFLLDLDDGYVEGTLAPIRSLVAFFARWASRYARYLWPASGAMIGLEVERQQASRKVQEARGADEEPYRWLTPSNLDYTWKILLSIVLVVLICSYVLRFVERIGVIALLIIGAIFFAYLIYPIVRRLNRKLPLLPSILIVYAAILGIVVFGLSYLVPAVVSEVTTLAHDWPSIQSKLQAYISNPHNPLLEHLPQSVRTELSRLPQQIVAWLQSNGARAAGNLLTVIVGTAAFIGSLIVIPVLAGYLLYDSESIKRFFVGFIPERRREGTLQLLGELEGVIGGFIRGQLLVGASVGALIALGLSLVHEPYAILIGVAAGALDLIPYIGPVIAAVPAILIGFVSGGVREAIFVSIVFVIANQAEGHIIAPNIVSRTIKLSPSAVVIAILIGGELYGVLGMFVAVPVAGIIRVLLLHVIPGSVSREEARPVLTKAPQEAAESQEGGVG